MYKVAGNINYITLLIAVLYYNNHPYYTNRNKGIDLFVVSIITIVTGMYDSRWRVFSRSRLSANGRINTMNVLLIIPWSSNTKRVRIWISTKLIHYNYTYTFNYFLLQIHPLVLQSVNLNLSAPQLPSTCKTYKYIVLHPLWNTAYTRTEQKRIERAQETPETRRYGESVKRHATRRRRKKILAVR